MTYMEYTAAKQKEVNDLPLFFAFSNAQLEKALQERGATVQDIYRLGDTGGFYLKKDAPLVRAVLGKKDELPELMKDPDFALQAFRYELDNHEYAINWEGDWEVCSIFCEGRCKYGEDKTYKDYFTEDGHSEWIPLFQQARRAHMQAFDEL